MFSFLVKLSFSLKFVKVLVKYFLGNNCVQVFDWFLLMKLRSCIDLGFRSSPRTLFEMPSSKYPLQTYFEDRISPLYAHVVWDYDKPSLN